MVELTSSVRPRASLPTLGRDIVVCAATAILITFFALFSVHSTSPPATVSADATLSEFSSGRAMEQLRVIARSPHPIGSLEHMAVRDYILREIAAHGFEPSVQKTTAVNRHWGGIMHAGTVQNLLARLEGTGEGKAVLLVAHYDSW